eukprot:RCo039784
MSFRPQRKVTGTETGVLDDSWKKDEKANRELKRQLKMYEYQRRNLEHSYQEVRKLTKILPPNHINYVEAVRNLAKQKKKTEELTSLSDLQRSESRRESGGRTPSSFLPSKALINVHSRVSVAELNEDNQESEHPALPTSEDRLHNSTKGSAIAAARLVSSSMAYYLDAAQFEKDRIRYKGKCLFQSHFTPEEKRATVDSKLPERVLKSSERLYRGKSGRTLKDFNEKVRFLAERPWTHGMLEPPEVLVLNKEQREVLTERLTVKYPAVRQAKLAALHDKTYLVSQQEENRGPLSSSELEDFCDRLYYKSIEDSRETRQALDEKYYPVATPIILSPDDLEEMSKRLCYSNQQGSSSPTSSATHS